MENAIYRKTLYSFLVVCFWFSFSAFCPIQHNRSGEVYGNGPNIVSGNVKDMNGVRKGIRVTLKGKSLGTMTTMTDEKGYFHFSEIPAQEFVIVFSFDHDTATYHMRGVGFGKNIYMEDVVIKEAKVRVERIRVK